MPQNPQRPVHALLGNHEPTKTLANWGFMFFDD
jgi:hypothetical protein